MALRHERSRDLRNCASQAMARECDAFDSVQVHLLSSCVRRIVSSAHECFVLIEGAHHRTNGKIRTSFSNSSKNWEARLKKPRCTRPGMPMASVDFLSAQGNW